nr:putative reverse transcriptase domain-containing protein [Tanacetum cinerariifolium]
MADLPPLYVAENPDNEPVNNMDEFALHMNPQQEGNMNGWIKADVPLLGEMDEPLEDEEEDLKEEEMEDKEMVNDKDDEGNEVDDTEVINPYEEADPHNQPPPTFDEESEFAPPVIQIADADDVPIPPIIQFGGSFHIGESSTMRDLLEGNSEVFTLGPMCCDLKSVHKGVKRLSKQMHDMYKTEKKMAGKLRQDELRMKGQEFDIIALDSIVRENRFENSKMMKMIEGLSREFTDLKIQNCRAKELSRWEAWDEDDDPNAPRDTQPFKPRRSPCDSQIMPPRRMTQANIERLIADAIAQDRATRGSTGGASGSGGNNANQGGAPLVRECTYSSFIKCNPTNFKGVEGAVELCHWFERTESVFSISECVERNKVKFVAATLQGRALTWWNAQVATLGLEDSNIDAYTQRFNELVLLCPEAVLSKKKKVEAYIRGLPEIIKGEMTSSRHIVLNEAVKMANTLMERKLVAKAEKIAKSLGMLKQECGFRCYCSAKCSLLWMWGKSHKSYVPKRADQKGGNVQSQAYVIRDAEHNQGQNVVTDTFLLNNHYATILFDSVVDKSFVDIKFSHLIDIKPVKLNTNYEVELADRKVVSTNSFLRGCTLNLLDHLFDIDLMPIELGTFNVIVGMDWLVERDAFIVCGKKEVHMPYKNKTFVVKRDSSVSRLKVISCIKATKYIERGSQLFIAQVIENEPTKKQLQDVPVIRNFPEVFLDDLLGLPPPQQVEFKIEPIPDAAPVACAPYHLAPSKLKEFSDQLKELSEKGFIRPSSSPLGALVLFVKKKDRSFRMCIDYRELTKLIVKNLYPLLRIDDLFDQLQDKSKNKEDHEEHLKTILELLKNKKLYVKFLKCDFWLKSVQFLGHVNDSKGVHVDPAKVEAIRNWSAPTTPMELKTFIVYCDASLKGFGAVLMQREKTEVMKKDNVKAENLGRLIKPIFEIRFNGIRCFKEIIWLTLFKGLRDLIMHESHKSKYSIHPGSGKMYQDLEKLYWWPNMKADIATFEKITMDFVSRLPRTPSGYESIWVIVDRLTKSAYFLPMKKTNSIEKLAQLYLKEIVCRHGVPVSIISDRDNLFTSRFWKTLQEALGTQLNLSIAYHPKTNGQSERTIQNLEDMLRACVIDFGSSWDRHLPLIEFSYNNSYHKSYADVRRKPMEFEVGNMVMLKVSPLKGVIRFGKRGKLSPRYVGPFKIIERIGPITYKLELLDKLCGIHNTFHVSNLKKCLADENLVIPLDDKLHFIEELVEIMDREVKSLKQS